MSGQDQATSETQWYVARDGQQHGPLTDAEMRLFVQGGHLKPTDLIWRPGFDDWKPAPSVFPPKSGPAGDDATESAPTGTVSSSQATQSDQTDPSAASATSLDTTAERADTSDTGPDTGRDTGPDPRPVTRPDAGHDSATAGATATGAHGAPGSQAASRQASTHPASTHADATSPATSATSATTDRPTEPANAPSRTTPTPPQDDPFNPATWGASPATAHATGGRNPSAAQSAQAGGRPGGSQASARLDHTATAPLGQRAPRPQSAPAGGGARATAASSTGGGRTDNRRTPAPARQPRQPAPDRGPVGALGHGPGPAAQPAGPVIKVPDQSALGDHHDEVHEGRALLGRVAAVITGLVVLSGLGYVAYDHRDKIANGFNVATTKIAAVLGGSDAADAADDNDPGPPVIRVEPRPAKTAADRNTRTAALDKSTGTATDAASGAGISVIEPGGGFNPLKAPKPAANPAAPQDPLAKLDADFQSSPLWSLVKRQFPDWYQSRLSQVADMSENRSKTDVTGHLVSELVKLRRANAKYALAASHQKLQNVATAFLANLQSLSSHSTDACFSFISQGEASPQIIKLFANKPYGPAIEAQIVAIFEAISDGRDAPKTRGRAAKPDYDQLAQELKKLGWGQSDLKMFADPTALAKAPPARVCRMVQDWFQAHLSIPDKSVQERLLFETLRPVIAG